VSSDAARLVPATASNFQRCREDSIKGPPLCLDPPGQQQRWATDAACPTLRSRRSGSVPPPPEILRDGGYQRIQASGHAFPALGGRWLGVRLPGISMTTNTSLCRERTTGRWLVILSQRALIRLR